MCWADVEGVVAGSICEKVQRRAQVGEETQPDPTAVPSGLTAHLLAIGNKFHIRRLMFCP